MSAIAPMTAPVSSRRIEVRRDAMVIEGHALADVVLAGYVLGPELGTAPVVVVVGGITASPFPFGDGANAEAWWPALRDVDLIDPTRHTVVAPCWPGNGSTWRGFEDRALPPLSALGLADLIAAWLGGLGRRAAGDVHRRESRRARRRRARGAPSRSRRAPGRGLRGAPTRWLGHGDAALAARARARRPAHRRCRDRDDARAAAR